MEKIKGPLTVILTILLIGLWCYVASLIGLFGVFDNLFSHAPILAPILMLGWAITIGKVMDYAIITKWQLKVAFWSIVITLFIIMFISICKYYPVGEYGYP